MKISVVLLLSVFLPVIKGQAFRWGPWGPCPEPAVQSKFTLCRWYEIEKLPGFFETGKCTEVSYSLRADRTIAVLKMRVMGRGGAVGWTGSCSPVGLGFEIPSHPSCSRKELVIRMSWFRPISDAQVPYWVLSTDYTTSAVLYSCIDILRIFHVEYAWILGRGRSLPEQTVNASKEILLGSNTDVSRMTWTNQEGC
uniref:Apolipoprotein D n=1 Tax=Scleropages formosus TaxID=113540 RepID=A0A8C9RBJ3_SCLFO